MIRNECKPKVSLIFPELMNRFFNGLLKQQSCDQSTYEFYNLDKPFHYYTAEIMRFCMPQRMNSLPYHASYIIPYLLDKTGIA
jgi:hypothetical protein